VTREITSIEGRLRQCLLNNVLQVLTKHMVVLAASTLPHWR